MVWIVEWTFPSDNQVGVTVWDCEESALKYACESIVVEINDNWDLSDVDIRHEAELIQEHIDFRRYRSALKCFNSGETNNADYDKSVYWSVYECDTSDASDLAGIAPRIIFPAQQLSDDDDDDVEEAEILNSDAAFVATESGATCRCCHQFNDYAYADRPDGTHECYSCRSMKGVFA